MERSKRSGLKVSDGHAVASMNHSIQVALAGSKQQGGAGRGDVGPWTCASKPRAAGGLQHKDYMPCISVYTPNPRGRHMK